jgi:hypothetical protein
MYLTTSDMMLRMDADRVLKDTRETMLLALQGAEAACGWGRRPAISPQPRCVRSAPQSRSPKETASERDRPHSGRPAARYSGRRARQGWHLGTEAGGRAIAAQGAAAAGGGAVLGRCRASGLAPLDRAELKRAGGDTVDPCHRGSAGRDATAALFLRTYCGHSRSQVLQ